MKKRANVDELKMQSEQLMPVVTARDVTQLEKLVERCQEDLLSLKEFIPPEGGKIPRLLR